MLAPAPKMTELRPTRVQTNRHRRCITGASDRANGLPTNCNLIHATDACGVGKTGKTCALETQCLTSQNWRENHANLQGACQQALQLKMCYSELPLATAKSTRHFRNLTKTQLIMASTIGAPTASQPAMRLLLDGNRRVTGMVAGSILITSSAASRLNLARNVIGEPTFADAIFLVLHMCVNAFCRLRYFCGQYGQKDHCQ